MSLGQLHMLAYAAGFGAVSEDDIDILRDSPSDDIIAGAQTAKHFVPGRHMPDAPAPRVARIARDTNRAVTVVEPLWRAQPIVPTANSWAQHLVTVARTMSAYMPGRGATA